MTADSIARLAALIGEPARARMLTALMDREALTAGDLARQAGLSAPAASFHLRKLREGGCLVIAAAGRVRHYRLAGPEVAAVLEALMAAGGGQPRPGKAPEPIGFARTCYDHLAGRVGVALAEGLQRRGWLTVHREEFQLTTAGARGLGAFGIDAAGLRTHRRRFAPRCLDWTERRYHIAGALGAALAANLLKRRWVLRTRTSRVLHLTPAGRTGLRNLGAEL